MQTLVQVCVRACVRVCVCVFGYVTLILYKGGFGWGHRTRGKGKCYDIKRQRMCAGQTIDMQITVE